MFHVKTSCIVAIYRITNPCQNIRMFHFKHIKIELFSCQSTVLRLVRKTFWVCFGWGFWNSVCYIFFITKQCVSYFSHAFRNTHPRLRSYLVFWIFILKLSAARTDDKIFASTIIIQHPRIFFQIEMCDSEIFLFTPLFKMYICI